jgi:ABC-type antimicrobial peptide transport system permease subunit
MIVSAARHMVLPVLTLAVAPTTEVIRLMRISTSDGATVSPKARRRSARNR